MTTRQEAIELPATPVDKQAQELRGIRLDWAAVLASFWLVGGLFLDGWAHNHGKVDNTFFTPWHAVFYSGYLATAFVLIGAMIWNHARGYSWGRALPTGYELSLLGVSTFALGGVSDMIWHLLFGIESSTEALLSPTHLLLAFSIGLIVSGPLRAAWRRTSEARAPLPVLFSAALVLSVVTFMTQFVHPFVNSWGAFGSRPYGDEMRLTIGIGSILLQTAILMGLILILLKRWTLMPGSLALLFTSNAALLATQQDSYYLIPTAFVAGLAADLLAWLIKPSIRRANALRLFVFAVPVVLYALYFLTLMLVGPIWWTVHMWTGSIVLAGIAGLLLSTLVAPGQAETGR